MDTLEQAGRTAEEPRHPHFRQELIPYGHEWPSGVVLPNNQIDLYNLYTKTMNTHVNNREVWPLLFKDRSLFLTACLNEAEGERAMGNPMALLRRAVTAQHALWDVLDELEDLFDIGNDDKACDKLAAEVKDFACNGSAERLSMLELMQFIDTMSTRRIMGLQGSMAEVGTIPSRQHQTRLGAAVVSGVFSHDDDGEDIVTLRPLADASGIECHGVANIGEHAVQLTLDVNGGLCIKTHAKGQEGQVLGSLHVPRLAATLARVSNGRGDPLMGFTTALTELGFDKDEPVSGADTVDVVAKHYSSLLALVDAHENQQGAIS